MGADVDRTPTLWLDVGLGKNLRCGCPFGEAGVNDTVMVCKPLPLLADACCWIGCIRRRWPEGL